MWSAKFSGITFCATFIVSLGAVNTQAQIVPDTTLGNESSTITPQVTIKENLADLIEGGAVRDNNLFHSFSDFNVGDNSAVYFANPNGIANILTRVTGDNPSNIFGTLGVDGAANLFLLNPNGIVLGENAVLDLNGSFLATTADSLVFANDFVYSAGNPDAPPLLTVNLPLGVQFGSNPETIEVNSTGHNLDYDGFTFTHLRDNRAVGLEVKSGNTLALLGGEINLTGGNLTAARGNIELGSVEEAATINLDQTNNGFTFDYGEVSDFGEINLTNASSIDVSGSGGGDINLRGKNISMLDDSVIIANTLGSDNGGEVEITASESIEIIGQFEEFSFSSIYADTQGRGDGGDLTINGKSLVVQDGAAISASSFDAGNSGELTLNVADIELDVGFIISQTEAAGNGGNLTINGENLIVQNGSQISSSSRGEGNAGNLTLNVTDIEVFDFGRLASQSEATGDGNNLTIKGQSLVVQDGGEISSSSFGTGKGGDLKVDVADLQVLDFGFLGSQAIATGDGGDVTVTGENLVIQESGLITTSSFDAGNAGNLTVDVEEIQLIGTEFDNFFAGALYSEANATGDGGNVTITGERLVVQDGGEISSSTYDEGNAGNLTVNVTEIELIGTNRDDFFPISSGLFSFSQGVGNAGNLSVNGESLLITDGATISASTGGAGNAGNLNINVQDLEVTGDFPIEFTAEFPFDSLPSSITANSATDSSAGLLEINADNLDVTDNAEILVSNTGLGDAGNLIIMAKEINLDRGGSLNSEVNAGSQGNINLTTDNIFLSNNSEITAQATDTATGGNININNADNLVLTANSQIIANAIAGDGGNIDIITQGYFISADSLITASSEFGLDGNVEVETINGDRPIELDKLPVALVDVSQQITQTCKTGSNHFAIAGNGGLPENPTQNLRGQSVWQDLRLIALNSMRNQQTQNTDIHTQGDQLAPSVVEAKAWKVNRLGKIELTAINSTPHALGNSFNCTQ